MDEQIEIVDALLKYMGKEELLDELLLALDIDTANDHLQYIARMHDIPL